MDYPFCQPPKRFLQNVSFPKTSLIPKILTSQNTPSQPPKRALHLPVKFAMNSPILSGILDYICTSLECLGRYKMLLHHVMYQSKHATSKSYPGLSNSVHVGQGKGAFCYPIYMYGPPKNLIPLSYDHWSWYSCPKNMLQRAFVDGLTANNEKVASSKIQLNTRVSKTIPYLRPKWLNL